MSPSSLIFLLIVAIWAAYLLQHWVRRREHLATARSVDRFSEAMRVLERREPWLRSPVDAPERRSYAVSPVRAARASVVVKDARSDAAPTRQAEPDRPTAARGRDVKRPESRGARRLRGISLVVAVLALVALAVLVPVVSLPWWSIGIAGGAVVADLVWLRSGARRASVQARQRPGTAQPRRPAPEAVLHDDLAVEDPQPVDPPAEGEVEVRVDATPAVVDPHGWQPVPVPPPTYTLKARAERPVPPPAQGADTAAVRDEVFDGSPTFDDVELATTGVDYSRVPTSDLPFDGYALDEDLEDLPAVHQAV